MKHFKTDFFNAFLAFDAPQVWDIKNTYLYLKKEGFTGCKRTAERLLLSIKFWPDAITQESLIDELDRKPNSLLLNWAIHRTRKSRDLVIFAQLKPLPNGTDCLHFNDSRGARFWVPLARVDVATIRAALVALQQHIKKDIAVFPHHALVSHMRTMEAIEHVFTPLQAYAPVRSCYQRPAGSSRNEISPHLKRLEAESIHIIREAVAEAQKPAMLYSIGKDSGVMLHLARKAFYPAPPPFPLLHVDTRWKFQEMYLFRDFMAQESGMDLLVHINPEAIKKNINPFEHGSALHTDITKTEGLKQAVDHYKFDVVFGGARRDEEKSRAKERVFSFRSATHRWDPKNQRPELWNLYNTQKNVGESIRVFPLSNWTELDVWQYIYQEKHPSCSTVFLQTTSCGCKTWNDNDDR